MGKSILCAGAIIVIPFTKDQVIASGGDDGRVVLLKSDVGTEVNKIEFTKGFGLN